MTMMEEVLEGILAENKRRDTIENSFIDMILTSHFHDCPEVHCVEFSVLKPLVGRFKCQTGESGLTMVLYSTEKLYGGSDTYETSKGTRICTISTKSNPSFYSQTLYPIPYERSDSFMYYDSLRVALESVNCFAFFLKFGKDVRVRVYRNGTTDIKPNGGI